MKTVLLALAFFIFSLETFSQACGTSGPGQCTPTGGLHQGTFTPNEDIPCMLRGQNVNTVIQFTSLDTSISGIIVSGLRVDSIVGLPAGLCWSTNVANDSFPAGEAGCILISGITYAPPGIYKLRVTVSVMSSLGLVPMSLEQVGIKNYLRLIDTSYSFCPPIIIGPGDSSAAYLPFSGNFQNVAQVTGKLFFDANQNQLYDVGEQAIKNQIVNVGSYYTALTNANGDYTTYPSPGTYTVQPVLSGNIASFSFGPSSIVVNADSARVTYSGNNFGILAPANYCESSLALVSYFPPPRPGFNNQIIVRFENIISATSVSQTIEMTYDAHQHYVLANPAPASVDTVNHVITWNLSNIGSGASWEAQVTFYTPASVVASTVLQVFALVTNSTCASPDSPLQADEQITVVASCDPNDKAVSPVGVEPGGRIPTSTTKLNYTIRFQNTGTFLAENVSIVDSISPLLDMSTLRVQAASHSYEVLINGREVTFRFSQINLPDSNSNEPASHGYIKYSIKPTSAFVHGSVVTNRADIYFDFNAPVLTNTVQNRADNFIGITETAGEDAMMEVYPNPLLSGSWQLKVDEKMIGKELRVFDATGKMVYTARITSSQSEIDASAFTPGVYLLKLSGSALRLVKL